MGEWKETTLASVATSNNQSIGRNYQHELIQYLDTGSITNGKIDGYQEVKISEAPSRAKRLLKDKDIIYSTVRPIQRHFGFIENPMDNLVVSTGFSVIEVNQELASPKFIYYYLSSDETVEVLDVIAEASTTTYPSLKPKDIENLDILLPPLKEQKTIAEVLSSLDDKIDLLHRQNKTLEELAQALFRQWFIEEAKDEWEEYETRDFATHKKVSIKPAQNPNDNFLHFSLPAFDTNKEPNIELGLDIKSNKYQVEPYSILMSKLNPKTPRVWDIYFEPEKNSICSTEFQVVEPNDKELFPFISTLLKSEKVKGELAMSASGTSGSHQRVKPEDIFNISFLTPSVDKLKEFSNILEPNYLKQIKNQNQIQTLENIRDTLLPKLMSGEVRVKNEL